MLFPFVVDIDLLVLMVTMLKTLQNVWPVSALLKYDHELKVSDTLVSRLEIQTTPNTFCWHFVNQKLGQSYAFSVFVVSPKDQPEM